jgi:hypothetical protein
MTNDKRIDYVTRDSILRLLSDDEIAAVSTAETAARLSRGDQFIDLEHLDRGVQRALGRTPPMGRVLPRKAVSAKTWAKIVNQLAVRTASKAHSGRAKRKPLVRLRGTHASKADRTKHSA